MPKETDRYVKKPVSVRAYHFEVDEAGVDLHPPPPWIYEALRAGNLITMEGSDRPYLLCRTNHGPTRCSPGDWIIESPEGELYPCTDKVFQSTYVKAGQPIESRGDSQEVHNG